jgi:hypothetical protein
MSQIMFAVIAAKVNNIDIGIEFHLDTDKALVWVMTTVYCSAPADFNRVYTYKLKAFVEREEYELCSGEMTQIAGIDMDKYKSPISNMCPRLSAMSEPIALGDFKAGVIGIHGFELKDSVSDVCEAYDFRVVEWKGLGGDKPCAIDMIRPNMLRVTIPGTKQKEVEASEGVLRLRKLYPGKTDTEILGIFFETLNTILEGEKK